MCSPPTCAAAGTRNDGSAVDLHLTSAAPTDEERAAVDDLLGPPETGWVGGPREAGAERRFARSGRAAREQRDLLLPALHALQSGVGWISEGGLNYVCQRLTVPPAEAYGVATFYAMFSVEPRPKTVVHVCDDLACRVGGDTLCAELERTVGPPGDASEAPASHLGAEPVPGDVRARARRARSSAPAPARRTRRSGTRRPRRSERARGRGARPGVRATDGSGRRLGSADLGPRTRRRTPSAPAGGAGRPVLDRRLSRPRRLRGAAEGRTSSAPTA